MRIRGVHRGAAGLLPSLGICPLLRVNLAPVVSDQILELIFRIVVSDRFSFTRIILKTRKNLVFIGTLSMYMLYRLLST